MAKITLIVDADMSKNEMVDLICAEHNYDRFTVKIEDDWRLDDRLNRVHEKEPQKKPKVKKPKIPTREQFSADILGEVIKTHLQNLHVKAAAREAADTAVQNVNVEVK